MTGKNRIIELLESFTDTAGLIDVSVYDNDDAITLELSDGYGHEWFTADYDVDDLNETLFPLYPGFLPLAAGGELKALKEKNKKIKSQYLYSLDSVL